MRRWFRQRKNKTWNTCRDPDCFYKTMEPDGVYCYAHTWFDLLTDPRRDW